ncbi:hypothetical protein A2U01_0105208, partial [Trifolium medium]|nr:hypothetical protein [Trifolium medium]
YLPSYPPAAAFHRGPVATYAREKASETATPHKREKARFLNLE